MKGIGSQGYEKGLWELVVFIDYEHPTMNGDVKSYILEEVKNTIINYLNKGI